MRSGRNGVLGTLTPNGSVGACVALIRPVEPIGHGTVGKLLVAKGTDALVYLVVGVAKEVASALERTLGVAAVGGHLGLLGALRCCCQVLFQGYATLVLVVARGLNVGEVEETAGGSIVVHGAKEGHGVVGIVAHAALVHNNAARKAKVVYCTAVGLGQQTHASGAVLGCLIGFVCGVNIYGGAVQH